MIVVLVSNASGLVPAGIITEYTVVMFTKYFNETGSFELQIPFVDNEVLGLLQRADGCEKYVLLPDKEKTIGICHKVQPTISDGKKNIIVQGKLGTGVLGNYVTGLVQRIPSAVSEPESLMNFPLSLQYIWNKTPENISEGIWSGITYQLPGDYQDASWVLQDGYTGGRCSIQKYIESNLKQLNKGYSITYNQDTNKLDLQLISPVDRSLSQSRIPAVVISSEFGDISSSEYFMNAEPYKNIVVAYVTVDDVYYEEVVTYDDMTGQYPDYKKRVIYEEITDIFGYDSEGEPISESDIRSLLKQKGKEKLYENALISEYTCKLSKSSTFEFGKDYNIGDKINVIDKNLNAMLEANVTGYNYTLSQTGEVYEPIIGIPQPSLTRVLKQKGVI